MSQLSQVLWGAFEQVLSTDLNRVGARTSREITNLFRELFRSSDGLVRSGILGTYPTVAGAVGAFSATVSGPFHGFVSDAVGASGDVGDYRAVRVLEASTTLTFAAPEVSPRIDLVVINHATADTNAQVRNILVDPTARSVVPALVNKDRDPVSTLSVVRGTAAASPVRPAVPAGVLPLFEVWVPPGAADGAGFSYSRAAVLLNHLSDNLHGPEAGVSFNTTRPAAGAVDAGSHTPVVFTFAESNWPAYWIDGELVRVTSAASGAPEHDLLNDPFAVVNLPLLNGGLPAVGTAAVYGRAAYLYAYGGRNNPHPRGLGFVVSLTRPRPDGRPSAPLRVSPFGGAATVDVQRGACFVSPAHVGNSDGASDHPNTGAGAYLQYSLSGDEVIFAHGIARWRAGRDAADAYHPGIRNLNLPANAGGSASTTIALTGDWLPEFDGSAPDLVTSLLLLAQVSNWLDAATAPIQQSFFRVQRPATLRGRRSWNLACQLQGVTATLGNYGVDEEKWFERNNLDTASVRVELGVAFVGGGDWGLQDVNLYVGGYKMARLPRGRL